MKKIGIFLDEIKNQGISSEEKFQKVASNTGNLLFWHSLKSLLNLDIKSRWYIDNPDKLDLSEYKAFITTDLIWICQMEDYSYLNRILDILGDMPLIPISIGLQEKNFDPDFKLHPETVKVLKRISERCVMGVRGYYTADILTKYGVTNFQVVGCPSMYMPGVDFGKINCTSKRIEKVTSNFETFYSEFDMHRTDFLNYCAENNYSFVEQTQLGISETNIPDSEVLSKIKSWIDAQGNCFFDIDEWRAYMRGFDFSIGLRFHGNVMALWEGVPALFLTCDSRTKELCEFHSLPSIDVKEFDLSKPVEYYYGLADYSDFGEKYAEKLERWNEFLKVNSLKNEQESNAVEQTKEKVLYHISHAGALPEVLIHCLTVNRNKEIYLLTGTDRVLMGEIFDKLDEFVDCGIFKRIIKCSYCIGYDAPDETSCENIILEYFDKIFNDAGLCIDDFKELYTSCDTLQSFPVYAALKHKHFFFFEMAPNFFLIARKRVEEYGNNPGRKPYANTMIKYGAADGIGEYAVRMIYPNSKYNEEDYHNIVEFDFSAMLHNISDTDKSKILGVYGTPDIKGSASLLMTDSQWLMRALPDVRVQAVIMYQLLADYYIPRSENIVIKPHPLSRATTEDFIKYFNVPVFSRTFPSNLLGLVDEFEINNVYTTSLSSSKNTINCNNNFFIGGSFIYNYKFVKTMHYLLSLFFYLKKDFCDLKLFNCGFALEFISKMCEISFNSLEQIQNWECSDIKGEMYAIINIGNETDKNLITKLAEIINNSAGDFTLLFISSGDCCLPFDKIIEERYSNFLKVDLIKSKRKKEALDTITNETVYIYSTHTDIREKICAFNYQKENRYLGIDIFSRCYDSETVRQGILLSFLKRDIERVTAQNEILESQLKKQQDELNLIKELFMKG